MKKLLFSLLILTQLFNLQALEVNAEMFTFDEEQVYAEFEELNTLEAMLLENPVLTMNDVYELCPTFYSPNNSELLEGNSVNSISASGNMSYFWTAFAVSAVGTYFIYGAIAGPITVGVIYFTTNKDIEKTKKAAWGCAAGTLLGAGIKFAVSAM